MLQTPLYKFQTAGVRFLRDQDGVGLLAEEVGLGKTIQSLYYAWRYLPKDPPGPIVVVVPAHLKLNWKREAQKHLGLRVEVLSGQRVPDGKRPPHDPNQIFVCNYDILSPPNWRARASLPADSWAAWLISLQPRLIILDEAQMAKNSSAVRTRALRKICRATPRRLALSGTPLTNSPRDLWSVLNLLRPDKYPSELEFCTEYTLARKRWWGWEFKGARRLDQLHAELQDIMIRRRKCDVLDQVPLLTHTVVPVEVDLREYRKAEKNFLAWVEKQSPGASLRAAKAEELSRMNSLKQLAGSLKTDMVLDWSNSLLEETQGKLLLGALHYDVTGPLMSRLGPRAVLVDGRMTSRQKDEAFTKFNLDPNCDVLLGNVQAAGTGWNCTATSDAALCELPWRPGDVTQFAGRIYGLNRGLAGAGAHLRYLVASQTIEEDLCEVLQRKDGWARQAIDGDDSAGDMDIHDQVLARMKERN